VSILPLHSSSTPNAAQEPDRWPAFESFVREQYAGLCAYAYRYVSAREAAEEVVQDVLLRVWLRRNQMEQIELLPYVYRSIAHAAISRMRTDRAIRTRNARLQLEVAETQEPACAAGGNGFRSSMSGEPSSFWRGNT